MTIADMSRFYGPDYTQPGTGGDGIGPTYSNWDAQSTTACYCDQGHFGPDCSNREWRPPHVENRLRITQSLFCVAQNRRQPQEIEHLLQNNK